MKIIYSFIVLWTLVWQVQLSYAVREGTANAKVMIQRYEREGDFAKAALWHEAAADCLKVISIPMTEIQIRYYLDHGEHVQTERSREELANIKKRQEYHLKAAQAHWERSETEGISVELEAEREKITQFISTWVQTYPNRFYHYGIYPSFFKVEQEVFKKKRDYAAVLNLEADAAEMCANQYNEITVAYFRELVLGRDAVGGHVGGEAISRRAANHLSKVGKDRVSQYEKVRDTHYQLAALLRKIAEGTPKTLSIEAETMLRDLSHQSISPAPKLTSIQALRIANRDACLQEHLKAHTGVHGYASFQGFAWFVSYYNHGWGNLGVVLVDDKTGTVLDILDWLRLKESTKR
ncbi:hypothetical protein F4X33_16105 [Candidatus Poribacteria bacterium]|nr:hypothetical protein [Candidatus Poribacteria bacterium]